MLVVVSPHLDDAVFSCGAAIAAQPGALVVTLFAGAPRDAQRRTDWDARCGFADAAQALRERREEDRRALALLGATPRWLPFCDSQYDEPASDAALTAALREALAGLDPRPTQLLYPLGLFHSDHLLAHRASRAAVSALPGVLALAYEDALYRGIAGLLQRRLAALAQQGLQATPARGPGASDAQRERKAAAVRAYASQLRAFGRGGHEDLTQPERAWRLEPVDHAQR